MAPECPAVSVAIICMSGLAYLTRCLASLRAQQGAPEFEIVVVAAPGVADIEEGHSDFADARIVINRGQRSPLELATRAIRECRGEVILLTKDHCVPGATWVRAMAAALTDGRGAVGGRVEIDPASTPTEWAFHFIDFHRYTGPVKGGATRSLTVCSAAYRRRDLEAIREVWETGFMETFANEALCHRFGPLWMEPASEVTMFRRITLADAFRERYEYGRLFGASRVAGWPSGRRWLYAAIAPALPPLLMGRMATVAFRSRRGMRSFVHSLGPLTLLVLARCWGEWLAYLMGHHSSTKRTTAPTRH